MDNYFTVPSTNKDSTRATINQGMPSKAIPKSSCGLEPVAKKI